MLRKMSLLRFCMHSVFCLCLPAICYAAQASIPPKTIGYLDSQDALVFEGNKTYSTEQICKALYRDKDIIVSISPTASLKNHLKMLKYKIQMGYLNAGFFDPRVEVIYHSEPEHILVSIVEGPRYTKGPLVIHGASESLENDLIQCLNKIDPRVSDAMGISEVMQSISRGDMNAALTKDVYMALLWGSCEPPSFAPSFITTSTQYLNNLLRILGYYNSEFTLNLVPDHSAQTVRLEITFQTEGARPHIGTINLYGNTINSDEQILDYLGLKTGQPLNDIVVQTVQSKLISSGRFRFIEVKSEVNTDDPPQSTLNITLQETLPATPLGQTLTDKEALMQKVGQFMDRYQSWEKDVCIYVDLTKIEGLDDRLKSYGSSISAIEVVYSSRKGVVLSELIDETQTLNTIVLAPEHISYLCPPLNQYVVGSNVEGEAVVHLSVMPNAQKENGWGVVTGIGLTGNAADTKKKTFSYRQVVYFHPAFWFSFANDPENEIIYINDERALVKPHDVELEVNRQSGEIIDIRKEGYIIKFQKGAFEEALQKIKADINEHHYTSTTLHTRGGMLLNLALSLYLTHVPNDRFTQEQKIQAVNAWRHIVSGFVECETFTDKTQTIQEDVFPLPIEDQLASGGMMPMLLSMVYQGCHDNLPRDSWVRTLSHASVLMVSGHAQCASVSEELKQLYNSDQIGPVGYLLTAQFLKQLGYPAFDAFAQRGLQTMTADDFRKDWKLLLTKDSKIKDAIHCYLEKFQTYSSEDIQMALSIFPPEVAALLKTAVQRLKEIDTEQLHESLDPLLTEFWEKYLKEKTRRDLNELSDPQK